MKDYTHPFIDPFFLMFSDIKMCDTVFSVIFSLESSNILQGWTMYCYIAELSLKFLAHIHSFTCSLCYSLQFSNIENMYHSFLLNNSSYKRETWYRDRHWVLYREIESQDAGFYTSLFWPFAYVSLCQTLKNCLFLLFSVQKLVHWIFVQIRPVSGTRDIQ